MVKNQYIRDMFNRDEVETVADLNDIKNLEFCTSVKVVEERVEESKMIQASVSSVQAVK